ncbi:hypothetical protein CAC42_1652 [Sphaceloma murrayae]|uniref:Protein kinase domain-containing protein n=1 Tax=Sphaceloma murrayae TaxID=2082308 RepID=A0A2K1QIA0_9PEZI|nr:hypothetical protein CAC42_1652 [Sphaceloma murrayae]
MPHVLPLASSTGATKDEIATKEIDALPDDGASRRRSLLRGIQRLGKRRREDDGKATEQQNSAQELRSDPQAPIHGDGPVRRRSLLRRIPQKWRGKSEPARAAAHRRLKSEERPITPAAVPHDANTRRRAQSETRQAVVQSSRASSPTRRSSSSRPPVNGHGPGHGDLRDVAYQLNNFSLGDTAEEAEPPEEQGIEVNESLLGDFDMASRLEPPIQDEGVKSAGSHKTRDSTESDAMTIDKEKLSEELDSKWILNLSMYFRDETKQEKLFITYAERPNFWRRVTVTWDYRDVRKGSLEEDLKSLSLQRDKNMRVYESVSVSLPDISFFDTVTNLKLKTEDDDRLHIYINEDRVEIIEYPPVDIAAHIQGPRYAESQVIIEAHLSGFVYKVRANDQVCVKKEIPGPNNVDEFLYELNALDVLREADSVIEFKGIVTDEAGKLIKGILIAYAGKGSLVENIYDFHHTPMLPWTRRLKWAGQIIEGLAAIHEAGYVQGDFTLSNVVIDDDDNAHIIDLNRRGCPVGWEPPELMRLIFSKQKVGMMISTKTDLYQLGMVLYALAQQVDEPDRLSREDLDRFSSEIPSWYRYIVRNCLEGRPQKRCAARELHHFFQEGIKSEPSNPPEFDASDGSQPADPDNVVTYADIEEHRSRQRQHAAGVRPSRSGPNAYPYYTPSGNRVVRPHRRSHTRGRSSIRSTPASSRTSFSADYVTPARESLPLAPPSVHVTDQSAPRSRTSRKSSTLPRSERASKLGEEDFSLPDRTGIMVFGPPAHQDSGLGDVEGGLGARFRAPAHQDSGFDDFLLEGTGDFDRFKVGGRREVAEEASDEEMAGKGFDEAVVAARRACLGPVGSAESSSGR